MLFGGAPICAHASDDSPTTPGARQPTLHFASLGLAEGLPQADVRSAVRDSQGFIWFGTWLDGVTRYDGYTFKAYRHDVRNEHSLSFDNVNIVYEDQQHTLWVCTYGGGLDRYDRDTDTFVHYRHRPGDTNSLAEDTIRALYEDAQGRFWVGSGNGLMPHGSDQGNLRHLSA